MLISCIRRLLRCCPKVLRMLWAGTWFLSFYNDLHEWQKGNAEIDVHGRQ